MNIFQWLCWNFKRSTFLHLLLLYFIDKKKWKLLLQFGSFFRSFKFFSSLLLFSSHWFEMAQKDAFQFNVQNRFSWLNLSSYSHLFLFLSVVSYLVFLSVPRWYFRSVLLSVYMSRECIWSDFFFLLFLPHVHRSNYYVTCQVKSAYSLSCFVTD